MSEKTGRIFDIKRMAVHDGPGIRTTVFFKGCPLRCIWCHNPEGLSAKKQLAFMEEKCINCGKCVPICPSGVHVFLDDALMHHIEKCTACSRCEAVCRGKALKLYGYDITVDELTNKLLRDRDFYDGSGGGVTLSGGECLMQAAFVAELLKRLREEGIHTAVDTCGYVGRKALDMVIPFTDLFLYDVKAINEDVHVACTGKSNKSILENLKYLDSLAVNIEIRFPSVPGYNDGELSAVREFADSLETKPYVKVLDYHSFSVSKYTSLGMEYKCND